MYMLEIQCYVQVVLHAYCTYGVVCMIVQLVVYMFYMWCRIHVMHVVLCTCGIAYMLYSGAVYIWHCVHVV